MKKIDNTTLSSQESGNRFIKVPLCLQENPYTCGVACVQSLLARYGIIYHQDVLSKMLKQKPIYGTDYKNIIDFLKRIGFEVSFEVDMDIPLLKELIDQEITPILLIQAWKNIEINYNYDWNNSHYAIACGFNHSQILFMDPWTLGNYTFICNEDFMKRWHALDQSGTHHHCAGLIVRHEFLPLVYEPNILKAMK